MGSVRRLAIEWGHELALLFLIVMLGIIAGQLLPRFMQWESQLLLSRHLWETAILALGMTLIVVAGGIDLSIGSLMGLCAVAFGMAYAESHSIAIGSLVCLGVGLLGGALNGALVAHWRIHPLIVTLATYAMFRGIAEGASQGTSYSQFGDTFRQIARGRLYGLPWAGWIFVLLALGYGAGLAWHRYGRFLYAIGHNERAARYSGLPVDWMKFLLYVNAGGLAGLATLIYVSRFDTAKADAGWGAELDVITAVVIGGTAIRGGRGNLWGTMLGLLLIHETRNFVGRYWQVDELKSILVGSLLISTILLRNLSQRWSTQFALFSRKKL